MKKKEKIRIVLLVAILAAAIAFFVFFPAQPEELVVEEVEIVKTESLDLVGPGAEIVDIEEDIRMLDKELDSASQKLLDGLEAELQQL